MEKAARQDQPKVRLDKMAAQQDQPKNGGSALNLKTSSTRKIPEPLEPMERFRQFWERVYGGYFGSFEDTTVVPPMCYTSTQPVPKHAAPDNTVQIFSIKVAKEEKDLDWPLDVLGLIAIRDSIDPRRNLIFERDRDNCQTITEEQPFLLLTGRYRAPVIIDPFRIEVQLKAKGQTMSEDKDLIFNVLSTWPPCSYSTCVTTHSLNGIRSNLEFKLAVLANSVEATIRIRFIRGPWQGGMPGRVSARTANEDIVLLDSVDGLMPTNRHFKLSRRVVSVELSGELKVVMEAKCSNDEVKRGEVTFKPKDAGCSKATLKFSSCDLGIFVAWSKQEGPEFTMQRRWN